VDEVHSLFVKVMKKCQNFKGKNYDSIIAALIYVITQRHGIQYKIDRISERLSLRSRSVRKYYHRMKFLVKEVYGSCPDICSQRKEAKLQLNVLHQKYMMEIEQYCRALKI
jgi:transcription initiation factor TFIIIB Brf1 subunit/transcription initiation factor TFIIB